VGAGTIEVATIAQDADGAYGLALGVAQSGGVQTRRDGLAARAARVEDHVAHHTALDHFAQRHGEFPRFLRADEARERLLEHLVLAKAEQLRHGVVSPEDLALEVGDEDRIRGVGDDDVGIQRPAPSGTPAVSLHHVRLRQPFTPSSHFRMLPRDSGHGQSRRYSGRASWQALWQSASKRSAPGYVRSNP